MLSMHHWWAYVHARGKPHPNNALRQKYTSSATMAWVDAMAHTWKPAYATHATHPLPAIEDSVETLTSGMDDTCINKKYIVQPINYTFDHAWVGCAIGAYPTRLCGADLTGITFALRLGPEIFYRTLQVRVARDLSACLFLKPEHLADVKHVPETMEA